MSITTYQELQVAVVNWLTLPAHASRVTELIALFEARVKRGLRVRQMERRSTASTVASQATLALPTDYLEMRNLRLNTSPVQTLTFLPPHQLDTWHSGTTTGQPKSYKIVGGEIVFAPTPDGVYTVEIDYYYFTALSDAAPTNWLLTANPDVYLYGSLAQVAGLPDPDKRWPEWRALSDEIMGDIKMADLGARWNGAPLVARSDAVCP